MSYLSYLSYRPLALLKGVGILPRGGKSAYTDKQQRQAEHIEEGYEQRGVSEDEAERGGAASASRSHEERSASAKKTAETRRRHAAERSR